MIGAVHLVSLGCARNQVDSEMMLGRLAAAGWRIVDDPAAADAIVVNTCSFIRPAMDESIDTILELAEFKQKGRCRRLVVAGCLPERFREDIVAALPEVDRFLGTGAFDRIVEALADGARSKASCQLPDPDRIAPTVGVLRWRAASPSAYLKIAEGCDRHCTYCIIPKLRGRQKSVPMEILVAEARRLAAEGVRELVLVAQETTAYGTDLDPPGHLSLLLRRLHAAVPDVWLRVLYGHPESIDQRIIAAVGELPGVCAYFDLPVQHASDRILQRMGRRQTGDALRGLMAKIRRDIPDAVLRTTVIVGFPGESDADFQTLMDFVREVKFDHLGAFVYSDHSDLPSHGLDHHVPAATARRRRDRLMRLQRDISRSALQRHQGRTCEVLIETAPEPGLYEGRTRFQAPEVDGMTYVRGEGAAVGQIRRVTIEDSLEYDLMGALA
ncbi:MAG: 30S ribosomal protein S12 methylthiotransferase RimO [Desulfosarcinaceae bacterium]